MQSDQQDIYQPDEPPSLAQRAATRPDSQSSSGASSAFRRFEAGSAPRAHRERQSRVRRRRGRHGDGTELLLNKLLWAGLALVVVVYSLALAYTVFRNRHKQPTLVELATQPAPAAVSSRAVTEPVYNNEPRAFEQDIEKYRQALTLTKDGASDLAANRLESAEGRLRNAIELVPDLLVAHQELGRVLENKQDFAGAEAEWRRAIEINPDDLNARLCLAAVFLAGGQATNALEAARWALDADPYSERGHEIAAAALNLLKQPQQALAHLKRLATSNRDDLVTQNNLGAAYLAVNDYRNALLTFLEVLRVDPGNSVAFYNIAVVHARQGAAGDVVDTLTQAARKLGATFVFTWTQSHDFDPVRSEPRFQRFVEQRGEPPSLGPGPATSAAPAAAATEPQTD